MSKSQHALFVILLYTGYCWILDIVGCWILLLYTGCCCYLVVVHSSYCALLLPPYHLLGTSLSCYLICYAAVLLIFTYYAQYYAQEQELWSDYYAIYIQVCMSNSLNVTDNLRKTSCCIRVHL